MSEWRRQLTFDLRVDAPDYSAASFLIAPPNEAALTTARAWFASREPVLVICGPPQCGKTHLARLLSEEHGAEYLTCDDFLAQTSVAGSISIIDGMPPVSPREFLEAYRARLDENVRMLIVGEGHPAAWAGGLADLKTRLSSQPRCQLHEPDEALIMTMIRKGFDDRQIYVDADVIKFAAERLPRKFSAAFAFVKAADLAALAAGRRITKPFVQEFINELDPLNDPEPSPAV